MDIRIKEWKCKGYQDKRMNLKYISGYKNELEIDIRVKEWTCNVYQDKIMNLQWISG